MKWIILFIYKKVKNHKYLDLSINDFMETQKPINPNCDICQNNKALYNDNFYLCSCGKYLCKLCSLQKHIFNHYKIEYHNRYVICNFHGKNYISFCYKCKRNLCQDCETNHSKHKIILYKMEKPNETKINNIKKEIEENILAIEEFNKQIKKLNQLFNNKILDIINENEQYIKLYNKISKSMDDMRNY